MPVKVVFGVDGLEERIWGMGDDGDGDEDESEDVDKAAEDAESGAEEGEGRWNLILTKMRRRKKTALNRFFKLKGRIMVSIDATRNLETSASASEHTRPTIHRLQALLHKVDRLL
ncbi:hypothetical protein PQX77_010281 [Marasmius sp. AFHP31]|nr:hypothetical protein PQX77_010281 [Marasmius sp. AFHP31]